MNRYLSLALATLLGGSLAACSTGHGSTLPTASSTGSLQTHQRVRHMLSDRHTKDFVGGAGLMMLLYDAPLAGSGSNAQFNAGILGVDVIDANGDSWQLIANETPQVVNLLALQTAALNLGTGTLPPGTYPSVQLLLDPSTTNVTVNGQTYPVHFVTPDHPWWDPTQTIEAVEVPLAINAASGQNIVASLDFNVFESANFSDGVVYLTPKVAAALGDRQVHGSVVNTTGAPVGNATVVATDANGNVANVTVTGSDGSFNLHGINAGTYTITVQNTYTTDSGATVSATGADSGAMPSTTVLVGPSGSVNVGSLTD